MKTKPLCIATLLLLFPAAAAHADDRASSAPSAAPYSAKQDLTIDLSTGIFASDPKQGGVALNGAVFHRIGYFQYGIDGTYGDSILGYEYEQAAAGAGFAWQTPVGLRLDAIGEFGGTYYRHVGTGLFSSNPGAYGLVPTARARLGASYEFVPRGPAHVSLGLWAYGEDDLERRESTVSYTETASFDGSRAEPTTATERLGAARLGAMISLGGTFDLR